MPEKFVYLGTGFARQRESASPADRWEGSGVIEIMKERAGRSLKIRVVLLLAGLAVAALTPIPAFAGAGQLFTKAGSGSPLANGNYVK